MEAASTAARERSFYIWGCCCRSNGTVVYIAVCGHHPPQQALAALVHAGCQGIEDNLDAPAISEGDLSELSPKALADSGYVRLPESLKIALDAFEADKVVRGWFPDTFSQVYLAHKRAEITYVEGMTDSDRYDAYAGVY